MFGGAESGPIPRSKGEKILMKNVSRWSLGLMLALVIGAPMVSAQQTRTSADDDAKSASGQIRRSPSPDEPLVTLAGYRRKR